jgi:hypothetical protein
MTQSSVRFPELPEPLALSGDAEVRLSGLAAEAVELSCSERGRRASGHSGTLAGTGAESVGPELCRAVGVFVTIFHGDDLRGCLGTAEGQEPLYEAVPRLAEAAATRDWRFDPVGLDELPLLRVEITLLGPLVRLPGESQVLLGGLDPQVCGVYLRARGRSGLLLPQVARRLGWDARELLEQVSLKAGLDPSVWEESGTEICGFLARSWEAVGKGTLPRGGAGPR